MSVFVHPCMSVLMLDYLRQMKQKNENAGCTMTNITSNFYSSKVPKKNKKSSVSMGVNINWGEAVFIWRS